MNDLKDIENDTITVKQLIEQLQKVDANLPVFISNVSLEINNNGSWDAPLIFKEESVDVYKGKCRIHFTTTP